MAAAHDSAGIIENALHKAAPPVRLNEAAATSGQLLAGVGPQALLAHPNIAGRGNGVVRAAALQRMQQTYGNRAVQRFIQRCACGEEEAPQHEAVRREGETPPPQEEALPSDTGAVAEIQAAPVQRAVAKREGETPPPQEEELPSDTGAVAEI